MEAIIEGIFEPPHGKLGRITRESYSTCSSDERLVNVGMRSVLTNSNSTTLANSYEKLIILMNLLFKL